jgi:hypothetical protein
MRKLSPTKAIAHAFHSLVTYRAVALRIGMAWIPVLLVLSAAQIFLGQPDPQSLELNAFAMVQIVSAAVSLLVFSSMAVSWHRFILRDEAAPALRLDSLVLRHAVNFLLIMLIALVPAMVGLVFLSVVPLFTILLLPILLAVAAAVTCLSIKLPAVALGNFGFTFKDAWASCTGNFWQLLGVFLLNAAIALGALLIVILVLGGIGQISFAAAQAVAVVADAALTLFLMLFNASIYTSLYGFFVERRDF